MSALNLITNGDFNTPLDASNTEYSFGWNDGQVKLSTFDRSGVTENMLYVNGGTSATQAFWKQSVNLTAGQAYTFSYQVANNTFGGPAKIQLSLNDLDIGAAYATGLASTWKTVSFDFIATQSGEQTIQLKNTVITNADDDFFVDKLSLVAKGPVDTKAPAVSTVTDNVAGVANSAITFTVTFDEAVVGTVGTSNFTATNGTVTSVTPVSGTNAYTVVVTPKAGVASGNVALSLVGTGLKDALGNAVVDADLTSKHTGGQGQAIDTVAPTTAPTLSLAASSDGGTKGDNLTNATTPTLTGKAEANAWVSVYANGSNTALGKVQANASGDWSYTVGTALAHGTTNRFTAQQADAAGNTSPTSAALAITVDSTAAAPQATPAGKVRYVMVRNTQAFNAAEVQVMATVDGKSTNVALNKTVLVGQQGAWGGTTGTASYSASKLVDGGSNSIDTNAYASLTTSSDAWVQIDLGGHYAVSSVVVVPRANSHTTTLINAYVLLSPTAMATTSSNATALSTLLAAPSVKSAQLTGITSAGEAKTVAFSTAMIQPVLAGTGEVGATVDIFDSVAIVSGSNPSGKIGNAVVKADGTWSFQTSNMAAGSHSITTQQTDVAGNTSALSAALALTVESTLPVAPMIPVGKVRYVMVRNTQEFDAAEVQVMATVDGKSTNVALNKAVLVGQQGAWGDAKKLSGYTAAKLVDGGSYSIDGNAYAALTKSSDAWVQIDLGDHYTVSSVVVVPRANANATTLNNAYVLLSPTVIATSPTNATALSTLLAAPGIQSAQLSGITKAAETKTLTFAAIAPNPALFGTGEPGATVDIFDSVAVVSGSNPSGKIGSAVVKADGTWSFQTTNISSGNHSFTTQQTSAAGIKSGLSSAYTYSFDTQAPTVSTVTDNVEGVTNKAITFTVTFDEAVVGTVGTSNFTATNGTVTSVARVGNTNAYTVVVTPNAGVASGNVALSLVAGSLKDAAGNAVVDADLTSKHTGGQGQAIDTVAPTTAPTLSLAASSDGGTKGDNLTNATTPTLTGKAEANAWVSVYANGSNTALGKVQANASGDWSYTVGTALAHGTTNRFTAQQADAAGNTSPTSAALAITVDSTTAAAPQATPAGKVRYVMVRNTQAFNAAEVQVMATVDGKSTNVALNKTVLVGQQGAWGGTTGTASYSASKLVDGGSNSIDTNAYASLTTSSDAWVQIDLGEHYAVSSVVVVPRAIYHTTTLNNAYVLLSPTAMATTSSNATALSTLLATPTVKSAQLVGISEAGETRSLTFSPNAANPVLVGTGEVGATVDIFDSAAVVSGSNPSGKIGSTVVKADGTWSFQTSNMASGSHSITTQQTDVAGNTSDLSSAYTYTVAGKAPMVSSVTDNIDGITGQAITFTVTFDEAVVGTVGTSNFTASNCTVTSVAQVSGTNAYTVVVTPNAGIANGYVSLSLVGTGLMNAAGNAVVSTDLTDKNFQAIDTACTTPTLNPVADTQTAPVITGTGEAGNTITLTATPTNGTGTQTYTAQVQANGTWSVNTGAVQGSNA